MSCVNRSNVRRWRTQRASSWGIPLAKRISTSNRFTVKERQFVDEYLVDLNAARAYLRAGYKATNNVNVYASLLMKKPRIAKAVAAALQARADRVQIDADFVLKRAAEMLNADIGDIVDDNGAFLPIKQWPIIWRQTLSACDIEQQYTKVGDATVETGRVIKARFIDRLRALELVGRHVNVRAFVSQHEGAGGVMPIPTIDLSRLPREQLQQMLTWLRDADRAVIDVTPRMIGDGA